MIDISLTIYPYLGLLFFLVLLIFLFKPSRFKYKKLPSLFTPAELVFLNTLEKAVGREYRIFGKIRIADILTPDVKKGNKHWWKLFVKISSKHFDYVLCDNKTLRPICVIELNDSSHKIKDRNKRDVFIDRVCEVAKLPILWVAWDKQYDIKKIQENIFGIINKNK